VGGTFTLKGANSPLHHQLLSKVLKLSIHAHFSLILEQHILSDSHVRLAMTRPNVPRVTSSVVSATPTDPTSEGVRSGGKYSIFPSTFIDFFSRHNLRHRGAETVGEIGSKEPLDPVSFPSHQAAEIIPHKTSSEGPHEGHLAGRLRRLSLIGEKQLSFLKGHHRESSRERNVSTRSHPFANALRRVENSRRFLSTSIDVKIPLPKIMVDLAEKERIVLSQAETKDQNPAQRLRADDRVALTRLLGWDGRDAEGRGMSGILGFLRQQEISVLISHHPMTSNEADTQQRTPSASAFSSFSGSSTIQSTSTFTSTGETSSTIVNPSELQAKFPPCGKQSWVTYRYYSCSFGEDSLLGDWVLDIAKQGHNPCFAKPGCGLTRGQHETRIIHGGVRIVVRLADLDSAGEKQPVALDEIFVWESCAVCGVKTSQKLMTTGSLFVVPDWSFPSLMILLVSSPTRNIWRSCSILL
jgi:1-phosphatidylinositol-3-phosphate 5-kinase